MMSQTCSSSRAARSPVGAGGGSSTDGKFMSAILTYFPLVATEKGFVRLGFATNQSAGSGTIIVPATQALSWGTLSWGTLSWLRSQAYALMGPLETYGTVET